MHGYAETVQSDFGQKPSTRVIGKRSIVPGAPASVRDLKAASGSPWRTSIGSRALRARRLAAKLPAAATGLQPWPYRHRDQLRFLADLATWCIFRSFLTGPAKCPARSLPMGIRARASAGALRQTRVRMTGARSFDSRPRRRAR